MRLIVSRQGRAGCHSLWSGRRVFAWQPVSANVIRRVDVMKPWHEWKVHLSLPFLFHSSNSRGRGRDFVSKRTLRSRSCTSSIYYFLLCLRLEDLEPRFKFQRASRSKKEDEEARTKCREEGCNEWFLIFWIIVWI